MKILILKPSSLGDIIHAIPVLRLIKQQRPDWEVHWWIAKHFAPILEMDSDISALHYFDRHGWGSIRGISRGILGVRRMRRELYDVIIDLLTVSVFLRFLGDVFLLLLAFASKSYRDSVSSFQKNVNWK